MVRKTTKDVWIVVNIFCQKYSQELKADQGFAHDTTKRVLTRRAMYLGTLTQFLAPRKRFPLCFSH